MQISKRIFSAGFTLTELMAVVIIISILAVLATGSYRKAVERTRLSDGLIAASTVMESVNRYQAEKYPAATAGYPKYNQLDISFPNEKACTTASDYCKKTKYFEITIGNSGFVDAQRMKGASAGDYTVRVYSDTFSATKGHATECRAANDGGKDLCVSAGYGTCDSNRVCVK